MNAEVPDDLVEIHDPEVDPAALMAQIRERIRLQRETLGGDNREFSSFDATAYPEEPKDIPYDVNLYHHLRRANELYARFDTEPALAPSPLTRVPLLGPLWQRLRPSLHTLILIYVNRLAMRQANVNRHLVSTLNQLTVQCQEQQRAIQTLQAEVHALRQQVQ
jgi:hypothetical protein